MATGLTRYIKKTLSGEYEFGSAGCMSFTNRLVREYYIILDKKIDIAIVKEYISDLNKTFGCVEFIESITLSDETIGITKVNKSLENVIKITPEIQEGYYRLFINQMVRYCVLADAIPVLYTYVELKKQYPKRDFWFLFHLANLISFTNNYDGYWQPFTNRSVEINYDIKQVKENLKKNSGINHSVSFSTKHNINLSSLQKHYRNKNGETIESIIKTIYKEIEEFECIDDKNVTYLIKGNKYKGIALNSDKILITNDDFVRKQYKNNRFKKIKND